MRIKKDCIVIEERCIEPYFIRAEDGRRFTIVRRYRGGKTKPISHHLTLDGTLKAICDLLVHYTQEPKKVSIRGYISMIASRVDKITEAINRIYEEENNNRATDQ